MIKLVVSDIDGTLVPESSHHMNPEIYDVVRALKEKGILFTAASGRQYASMLHLFGPVAQDIIFIAENGTNVMCRGKNMAADFIDPDVAEELVRYLRKIPGGEVMLSTPECIYLETRDEAFVDWMVNSYKFQTERIEDLLPLCRKTNKISLYRRAGISPVIEEAKQSFGKRLNVAEAGEVWIDFVGLEADKGHALAEIQRMLHISVDETMAFGDNCNDIGMLKRAGESYAMENAHPQLKAVARHIAPPSHENGVARTIRERILNA